MQPHLKQCLMDLNPSSLGVHLTFCDPGWVGLGEGKRCVLHPNITQQTGHECQFGEGTMP